MNKKIGITVFAALLALAAILYFWLQPPDEPAVAPVPAPQAVSPAPPPATVAEPPPLVAAAPLIRYPLGELSGSEALPELERSDAPFFKALGDWINRRLPMLFFSDAAIRRIVETVDNLPRQRLPPAAMPLKPVPGRFITTGKAETLAMSGRNAARYTPHVRIMRMIDAGKASDLYIAFYPLFQKAYAELSNSNAYFNDRLVEAIDDMLATPAAVGPLQLVRTGNYFAFADPALEARSAGQKILLRTGPANATAIKAKLCEIREKVTQYAVTSVAPQGNAATQLQLDVASVCLQARRDARAHQQ